MYISPSNLKNMNMVKVSVFLGGPLNFEHLCLPNSINNKMARYISNIRYLQAGMPLQGCRLPLNIPAATAYLMDKNLLRSIDRPQQ